MGPHTTSEYVPASIPVEEIDALLLLSFGGPEGMDEVRPFLENVTAGRGIPPERLDEVGAHYYHFGGVSPLNALNREMIANIEQELRSRGMDIPVYFGNRNWKPYAGDAAREIAQAGHQNVAVFATSAWGGYSGCYQYDEDIQKMRALIAEEGLSEVHFYKLSQFFAHPDFLDMQARATRAAFAELGFADPQLAAASAQARLVFTAHSIPVPADEGSGIASDGTLYSNQVAQAAAGTAQRLGITDYDVVWQSASGNGRIPWLEPDIVDHAEALHHQGVSAVVVVPIGFISDHMEVVWDLDNELADAAKDLGMQVARAATVGPWPEFAALVVDLVQGLSAPGDIPVEGPVAQRGCTVDGAPCAVGCCQPRKRPHSAQQ
ncbi:ferrochelatase [Corynebacterium sp. 153RC1]|uniref:ferrochelatase n=1 Tax=unclassified Corynebacterium TaxID=2624378 RepID=UPI00211B7B26|nr:MULTISPECIES: ferrochelatase [unclassified Corynebacterium]MCQ9369750.1 ferrochelatase [Corynebacterium sp. 35RC1]MCQ9352409.1 ferrochelatase [Corynebacterium sp. 209RC1]MCQ9354419.1 ferrochelatase [Corynebacterium sp. 1222RC1]MCQ9356692.1 ferrochelatase [Corynebacterium sp. 122RC1]MCQ9358814.1 ferrochelatase [Corynebacterium sp. 142RC1]